MFKWASEHGIFKDHYKADSNTADKCIHCDALESEMQVGCFTG